MRTGVVLGVVCVLGMSGCASETGGGLDSAGAAQQRAFPAVYDQVLDWQACDSSFEYADDLPELFEERGGNAEGLRCAEVTAPLDWEDPQNEDTITLSILHLPASGDEPLGTLLSNPGGPGSSGTELALGLGVNPSFATVAQHYDLLGFDPRGIQRSSAVECESESEILELVIALCVENDPLASSMGSAQVARDMELLRHLMGDDVLNYAGFSYGTVIGASYATLFPERVGRIMLDSAWPTDWSSALGSYQQREAIAHSLNQLLAECGTTYAVALCPLDGQKALLETTANLDGQPLRATDGTEVTGTMFSGYLTAALYVLGEMRSDQLTTAGEALAGNQVAIDEIASSMSSGGAAVGASGMLVRCLSAPLNTNLAGVYHYIEAQGLPELLGGPEVSDATVGPYLNLTCEAHPDRGEDHLNFSNTSDSTMLVFGVTGDHATPYAGAVQMVEELGNARLVTVEGAGHIATFTRGSACADQIATEFFVQGTIPAEGTVCTDG